MEQPLWKTLRSFLKKINIYLSYYPAIPCLGTYQREMKAYVHTRICIQMFPGALSAIAQNWKQPKCSSTGEWINMNKFLIILNKGRHKAWACWLMPVIPALWEAEVVRRQNSLRPGTWDQPRQHSETLSLQEKKKDDLKKEYILYDSIFGWAWWLTL